MWSHLRPLTADGNYGSKFVIGVTEFDMNPVDISSMTLDEFRATLEAYSIHPGETYNIGSSYLSQTVLDELELARTRGYIGARPFLSDSAYGFNRYAVSDGFDLYIPDNMYAWHDLGLDYQLAIEQDTLLIWESQIYADPLNVVGKSFNGYTPLPIENAPYTNAEAIWHLSTPEIQKLVTNSVQSMMFGEVSGRGVGAFFHVFNTQPNFKALTGAMLDDLQSVPIRVIDALFVTRKQKMRVTPINWDLQSQSSRLSDLTGSHPEHNRARGNQHKYFTILMLTTL